MKKQFKISAFLASIMLFSLSLMAQAPNKFNYQAVAKNANGDPVTGSVKAKFSILEGTASGMTVYSEEHTNVSVDLQGVFSLQIGAGTPLSGVLANLNWGASAKFLKVEIDFGSGYTAMGLPQQFVSVPYAEFAENTSSWTVTTSGNIIFNTVSNVGIGTSAPARRLHVNANEPQIRLSDPNGFVELYGGQNFQVMNGSTIFSTLWSGNQSTTPRLGILGKNNWDMSNTEGDFQIGDASRKFKIGIALSGAGAGNTNIHTSGNILGFGQSTNYSVLNIVGGNVAIGTVTPLAKFHVNGTGYFSEDMVVRKKIYAGDAGTDPQGADIIFGSNNVGSGEWLGSKRTTGGNQYGLDFYTASQNRLSIWNDGRVSINKGSLQVKQSVFNKGLALEGWDSGDTWSLATINNSNHDLNLFYNGSFRGYFSSINGNYVPASDRRLKTEIEPFHTAIDGLMKITPVSYRFVSQGADPQRSYGLIAQEVEKVFPELVHVCDANNDLKGTYSLDYTGLSVVAIKAIQEQQKIIEALANQVKTLEHRLLALENK